VIGNANDIGLEVQNCWFRSSESMEKESEGSSSSQTNEDKEPDESPPSYQEVLKWQAEHRKPMAVFVDNGSTSVELVEVQSNRAEGVCKKPVASSRERLGSSVIDIDSIQVECNITGSIHGSAEIRCLMEEMKNQQKYNSSRQQGHHQSTIRQIFTVADEWFCTANSLQIGGICIILLFIVVFITGIVSTAL